MSPMNKAFLIKMLWSLIDNTCEKLKGVWVTFLHSNSLQHGSAQLYTTNAYSNTWKLLFRFRPLKLKKLPPGYWNIGFEVRFFFLLF
jgi:hypothetical protein